MKRVKAATDRKLFLDGLRGWASLAVVLGHLFVPLFAVYEVRPTVLEWVVFFNGQLAVCLFFVISGFALSTAYVKKPDTMRLAHMAAARYFRLVIPIFAACFVAYLCLVSGLIPNDRPLTLNRALRFDPSFAGFLQFSLWDVFFDFRYEEAYILPLWTMQYELAGSVLVFGMLLLFRPIELRMYIYMALTVVLLLFDSYYALFTGGIILAELYQRRPQRRSDGTKRALIAALVFALFIPWISQNNPTFSMLLGSLFIVAAFIWLPPLKRFLENPVSQFLGRISFVLYLVHPILMYTYSTRLFYGMMDHGISESSAGLFTALITLPLAVAVAAILAPVDGFAHRASRDIGKKLVSGARPIVYAARQRMRNL